jgi:hypothetical protein
MGYQQRPGDAVVDYECEIIVVKVGQAARVSTVILHSATAFIM